LAGFAITVESIEPIPEPSFAERVVADVLAIGAAAAEAERVRDSVPLWFHTFALAPGIYTPGIARDHGYRLAVLGADRFAGRSVLDVGAFDGFYSFLAEVRGARRVVAVDNEQYVDWVRARFGVTLQGGTGFRAIASLLASRVEYSRMDALDVHELGERFDVVLCFGILHRVTDPIALLRALADVLAPGGEIVLETYGSRLPADSRQLAAWSMRTSLALLYWADRLDGVVCTARSDVIAALDVALGSRATSSSLEVAEPPRIDDAQAAREAVLGELGPRWAALRRLSRGRTRRRLDDVASALTSLGEVVLYATEQRSWRLALGETALPDPALLIRRVLNGQDDKVPVPRHRHGDRLLIALSGGGCRLSMQASPPSHHYTGPHTWPAS